MQLLKGIPDYALPDDFDRLTLFAVDRGEGYHHVCVQMSLTILMGIKEKDPDARGVPTFVAIELGEQRLWVHPTPDQPYTALARYTPTDREF